MDRRLHLKIILGVVVAIGVALIVWHFFKTRETAAYVDEVSWEHHVSLLEDYMTTECSSFADGEGRIHTECHNVSHTRTIQHEVHQGTNGLKSTTWPTVSPPRGDQYVEREAIYTVKFYRENERWNYKTGSIGEATRFKPGKMWLIKVNRLSMVWPQRETGAEG